MIDETTSSVHLKRARKMLPNVPQVMFDMFFVTLVEDVGWPFLNADDSVTGSDWQRVFSPFTPGQIVDFEWDRKSFSFDRDMFWRESFRDVNAVVKNALGSLPRCGNYDYERCRKSTIYHLERLATGKGFDLPIVLAPVAEDDHKYKILDGNHRVAAAYMYEIWIGRRINFDVWVGRKG